VLLRGKGDELLRICFRTIDDSDARMGFMRLSERGKALFGDDAGESKG